MLLHDFVVCFVYGGVFCVFAWWMVFTRLFVVIYFMLGCVCCLGLLGFACCVFCNFTVCCCFASLFVSCFAVWVCGLLRFCLRFTSLVCLVVCC